jgi:hypothetical protein
MPRHQLAIAITHCYHERGAIVIHFDGDHISSRSTAPATSSQVLAHPRCLK